MSCSAFRYRAGDLGLCPVCGFEVENDQVGEVGSMFVLASKDEQFVTLIKRCGVSCLQLVREASIIGATGCLTHSHAWYVPIIVDQAPLMTD